MWRTFAYFISLVLICVFYPARIKAQDTIPIPLKIRIGADVVGPAIYYSDKNIFNTEAYVSVDLNEKRSAVLAGGYLNYKYSQYNYSYLDNGIFIKAGIDFNLLKPDKSLGKYWTGIGLRYGLSRFSSETPAYSQENYWGTVSGSIPTRTTWGHFIEIAPGVRAEIFKNFSMGWSLSLRMLVHSGGGKDLKPVYFPGFGNASNTINAGISYFLVWNIPYKKINAILKKEAPQEEEEETPENEKNNQQDNNNQQNYNNNTLRKGSGVRQ